MQIKTQCLNGNSNNKQNNKAKWQHQTQENRLKEERTRAANVCVRERGKKER